MRIVLQNTALFIFRITERRIRASLRDKVCPKNAMSNAPEAIL